MTEYIRNILDYFAFVHRRRLNVSFPVFSKPSVLIAGFCVSMALVLALIWLIDPIFLAHMQKPDWERNAFFEAITDLGNSNWLLISTGIVLVILSVLTADRFEGAKHMIWHRLFLYAYFLFTSVFLSGVIDHIDKMLLRHHYAQFA